MTERDTPEVLHAGPAHAAGRDRRPRPTGRGRRRPDIDPDLEHTRRPHRDGRGFGLPISHVGLVFIGGCAGTLARWAVTRLWPSDHPWPWAVLVVNLVGSFVLGALLEHLASLGADKGRRRGLRLLAGVGFCGAFTTYSSFATAAPLLVPGSAAVALGWLAANLVGCLLTAWLGMETGRAVGERGARSGPVQERSVQERSVQERSVQERSVQERSVQERSVGQRSVQERAVGEQAGEQ